MDLRLAIRVIEAVLFGGRLLLLPIYLAMLALLGMLMVYFIGELAHALPALPQMRENDLVVHTLSLVDLSLTANLVVVVIASGYENFIRSVKFGEADPRPQWLFKIDFTGLKLKLLGTMSVIAAVHLLRSFLVIDQQSDRSLLWQVVIVITFAVLALLMAVTDRMEETSHRHG